ncbi:MAG: type II toxin-antitoxin system VapC family toxin [Phormidesmis sp.]
MYLLDTNICIAITNANPNVLRRFNPRRDDCMVPIVVVAELYKGAYCSRRVKENLDVLYQFLKRIPIAELDLQVAQEFGLIQSELRRLGRPTSDMDALIAAIGRSHSATLVTHNTADFANIPNLQLEDWLDNAAL